MKYIVALMMGSAMLLTSCTAGMKYNTKGDFAGYVESRSVDNLRN